MLAVNNMTRKKIHLHVIGLPSVALRHTRVLPLDVLEVLSLTWSEYRITALEADDFAHLSHDYMLHEDEDGSDLVREHVGVGGCREPLTRHGDEVQAA